MTCCHDRRRKKTEEHANYKTMAQKKTFKVNSKVKVAQYQWSHIGQQQAP